MSNDKSLALIDDAIAQTSELFVSTLSQYKWNLIPDTQLQAAKMQLTKNELIMKIAAQSPEHVKDALVQSAVLGLDLTEGKRQGWLLPRKNQMGKVVIQLQVGYKGVEAIHQAIGVIDTLTIRTVREKDGFKWSGNDQEKPVHDGLWFKSDEERGKITGAFAVTYYPGGSINVVVTSISTIYEKHRDRSESYKSYKSKKEQGKFAYPPPWVTDEQSMVEKTMAYIAAKQWPANVRDEDRSSKMLETLHETDVSDYSYGYTAQQKDAFYSFIDSNDSLGMYLFTHRVGIEVYSALTYYLKKSFQKGKKMKLMQEHNDFVETGHEIFINLRKSIEEKDLSLLSECIEDVQLVTYKLINSALHVDEVTVLEELKKELNQQDEIMKVNDTTTITV